MKEIPRRLILGLIYLYQKTVSPDHSRLGRFHFPHGACRYYPTCSQYGYQTIEKDGLIRGIPKVLWRILRCNPWAKGGADKP